MMNFIKETIKIRRLVRQIEWFMLVHLQELMRRSSQMEKFIVLMKIGLRLDLVKQFGIFLLSSLIFLCSYIRKGSNKNESVKYLQEFLVNDSDFTSPISQHGTKAENIQFKNRIPQAKNELTLIV